MKELLVNQKAISDILKDFDNDSINQICEILRDNAFLEKLWSEKSIINKKLILGAKMQKDLNATIKTLAVSISRIIDTFYNACPENLPEIVRKPIIEAVAPLAKAHPEYSLPMMAVLEMFLMGVEGATQYLPLSQKARLTA